MKRGEKHAGQGLVELALALPVLLLILLGTVDMGRMFFDYVQIRNAAREAAGHLSRNPDEPGIAADRAWAHGIPSGASVSVSCSGSGCTTSGQPAEARAVITSTFTPVAAGFLNSYFGIGTITLRSEASMRVMS
jgi:hypothetical protein